MLISSARKPGSPQAGQVGEALGTVIVGSICNLRQYGEMTITPVKHLELEMSRNRLGDCWMVLTALSTAAALRPGIGVRCAIPAGLRSVAGRTFAGRLEFPESVSDSALRWSNAGLRGMLPEVLRGRRFVAPYPRIVAHVRKLRGLKSALNLGLLGLLDVAGRISLAPWNSLEHYIGFIQLVTIPHFRDLAWADFLQQAKIDFELYRGRLVSAGNALTSRPEARNRLLVFSSGVSQQSMPEQWAKTNLPEALSCFHRENGQAAAYRAVGLETALFDTPEELVRLALDAAEIVATDSFPSHILQLVRDEVTLCLTQDLGRRVVSPCFRGRVIESTAPCAPCAGPNPSPLYCLRGYRHCLSWGEKKYGDEIISSITRRGGAS